MEVLGNQAQGVCYEEDQWEKLALMGTHGMGRITKQGDPTAREAPLIQGFPIVQNPFERIRIHLVYDGQDGGIEVLELLLHLALRPCQSPALLRMVQLLQRRRDKADNVQNLVVGDGKRQKVLSRCLPDGGIGVYWPRLLDVGDGAQPTVHHHATIAGFVILCQLVSRLN
jgi:hypothetical protein